MYRLVTETRDDGEGDYDTHTIEGPNNFRFTPSRVTQSCVPDGKIKGSSVFSGPNCRLSYSETAITFESWDGGTGEDGCVSFSMPWDDSFSKVVSDLRELSAKEASTSPGDRTLRS